MKPVVSIVAIALALVGCSRQGNNSAARPVAADHGKGQGYFRNLFGAPKSEMRAEAYDFSLPMAGGVARLSRNLIVQEYETNKLKASVIYSETAEHAIWVRYRLPDPWTEEQLNAALNAYGSDWKIAKQDLGVTLILRDKAPAVYVSSAGTVAYKTVGNELVLYAPRLYSDLLAQIEESKRQKKAVPQF
jgi:hypothetical protein